MPLELVTSQHSHAPTIGRWSVTYTRTGAPERVVTVDIAAGPGWVSIVRRARRSPTVELGAGLRLTGRADAVAYALRHDELAAELSDAIDVAWPAHYLPPVVWS